MKITLIIDDLTEKSADDLALEIIMDLHNQGLLVADYFVEEA